MMKPITTKEEALRRVEELGRKVDGLVEEDKEKKLAYDATWAKFEEAGERLKAVTQQRDDLLKMDKVRVDQVLELTRERDAAKKKLEGFAALEKALAGIRVEGVTAEQVRQIVRDEFAKASADMAAGLEGSKGVLVTEAVPNLKLEVSRPWLNLDESTVEGQVTVMALGGKLSSPFTFADVKNRLMLHYAWGPRPATIQKALDALVGKYKVLDRTVDTKRNQAAYSLRSDAKGRVKETETKEPVAARAE
jgi:hypothetical protein